MDSIRSGTTIRQPSTANLFIDSADRTSGTAGKFSISKQQNILSGYFTRLAVVEMVLDWRINNISLAFNNLTFQVTLPVSGLIYTASLLPGNYTVSAILDSILAGLQADAVLAPPAGGVVIALTNTPIAGVVTTETYLTMEDTAGNPVNFIVTAGVLQTQLGMIVEPAPGNSIVGCIDPNVQPYRYVDFICSALTYQQGLKDATTALSDRDVLYRWYFASEDEPNRDARGYPILQGYLPFLLRRYLSYPKQIKWDTQQPLGQLLFELYGNSSVPIDVPNFPKTLEWQMTLLISEQ